MSKNNPYREKADRVLAEPGLKHICDHVWTLYMAVLWPIAAEFWDLGYEAGRGDKEDGEGEVRGGG